MRRLTYGLVALLAGVMISAAAFAQDSGSTKVTGVIQNGNKTIVFERSNSGLNLDKLSAFSEIAEKDPELVQKLAKNPSLINSDEWVAKHPVLQQYLEKYPDARADIATNPGNYMEPTNGSAWTHKPAGME